MILKLSNIDLKKKFNDLDILCSIKIIISLSKGKIKCSLLLYYIVLLTRFIFQFKSKLQGERERGVEEEEV